MFFTLYNGGNDPKHARNSTDTQERNKIQVQIYLEKLDLH